MKIEVISQAERKPTEWFRSKGGDALYLRGEKGGCLTNGTFMLVNYSGKGLADTFENTANYERLYEGDQIVITL